MTFQQHRVERCAACGQRNRVPAATSGRVRCAGCRGPLPWVADADDATFAAVAESSSVPVLVGLWAPWCGPCRTVSPTLERLAREYPGRVKVDVDQAPALARRFGVQGIPTLLVMHGDPVVARQTGAPPEPALRAWLDGALAST